MSPKARYTGWAGFWLGCGLGAVLADPSMWGTVAFGCGIFYSIALDKAYRSER